MLNILVMDVGDIGDRGRMSMIRVVDWIIKVTAVSKFEVVSLQMGCLVLSEIDYLHC